MAGTAGRPSAIRVRPEPRLVRCSIRFQDRLLFLADPRKLHHVGFEESADGVWSLYLGSVLIGRIGERSMKVYGEH
jgi:hypothetical protein